MSAKVFTRSVRSATKSDEDIPAKGKLVCWSVKGETDVEKVKTGFAQIYVGKNKRNNLLRYAPEVNTAISSLKQSLDDHCKQGCLIRPIKGERGYAVVKEQKSDEGSAAALDHGTLFEVRLPETDSVEPEFDEIEINGLPIKLQESIVSGMKHYKTKCSKYMLGKKLVDIVDRLQGTSFTTAGGIYWLPDGSVDAWNQVADVIENSGTGNVVGGFRVSHDDESTRTVLHGLMRNIKNEVSVMNADIDSATKELGHKALKTKAKRTKTLMGRVKGYASMFGEDLKELDSMVGELQGTLAVAVVNALSTKE
jgi:hypothetical protein